MASPKVSVIIPLYNAEKFIEETIASLLNQTFSDFELLIMDDASTDGSAALISKFQDNRIRLVRNERNIGVAQTMNRAMQFCQGEYLARMDADDLADPRRLELQCRYLDEHPAISAVGADIIRIDGEGKELADQYRNPHSWGKIKWHMLINCSLAQPTVMARKQFFVLTGGYEDFCGEDYHLWLTAIRKGLRLSNLPVFLLRYRIHGSSISNVKYNEQLQSCGSALRRHAREFLGVDLEPGLAEYNFAMADRPVPLLAVLKLVPFYFRIICAAMWDRETNFGDLLFICRRTLGRLMKGAWRSAPFKLKEAKS